MRDPSFLSLRAVSMADARLLLAWRNDPVTRSASRNGDRVGRDEHEAWLTRMLASADHVIRIAEADGAPVGVVRADRSNDGWKLSWTVAPQARGRGFGSRMLVCFVRSLDGRLLAVIRKDNAGSRKIAAAAGLKHTGGADDPQYEHWTRSGTAA
jgi:RimJ/RimL family protein N-acetyltransferase